MLSNVYWTSEGRFQKLYKELVVRIPLMGECPKDQPKLEKLRKAGNVYYNLFNNGEAAGFKGVFGVSGKLVLAHADREDGSKSIPIRRAEAVLDLLILDAAIEAKLELE